MPDTTIPFRRAAREQMLRLLAVTVGGLFVAFAALAGVFFWYENAANWVDHTRKVRTEIAEVVQGLSDAEAAQRGLLLTGDARFVTLLAEARQRIANGIGEVDTLTADNAPQQERVTRLKSLSAIRMGIIDRTVAMNQAGQGRMAVETILQGQGLSAMDDIRQLVDELAVEEARLEAQRVARAGEIRLVLIVALIGFAIALAFLFVRGVRQVVLDREAEAQVSEELRKLVAQRTLLLDEVNHRVKNSLQQVASIIRLQSRTVGDPGARQALDDALSRIMAVGRVHEQLYKTAGVGEFDAGDYTRILAKELVEAMGREDIELELDVTPAILDLTRAVPLALILNELITNALKYGCLPDTRACVRVAFNVVEGQYRLSVADNGPGVPEGFTPQSSKSLGMRVIQALSRQLNGRFVVEKPQVGAEFAVVFPKETP